MNSLPDLAHTILDRGQWGSFAQPTCDVGRATRSPETGGVALSPETIISEPSRAPASLHHLIPSRDTVRGQAGLPGS